MLCGGCLIQLRSDRSQGVRSGDILVILYRDSKARWLSPTRQTSSTAQGAKQHGLMLYSVPTKPENVSKGLGNGGPE